MRNKELAKRQFVEWIARNEPFIYRVAEKRLELENNGLAAIDWGKMFGTVTDTIKTVASDVAPQYLQYKQQKKIMDMQMKRAEQGLPPANVEDYTPAIKISPQITPESEQAITRVAVQTSQSAMNRLLPFLAIGGLGAMFLFMRRRR